MFNLTINGTTYPKVTGFKTSQSIIGDRLVIKQANGVRHSILIDKINKLEIERVRE